MKKRRVINEIIQLLYPDDIKCIVCGREIHPNRYGLCSECKLDINVNYCIRCGRHKVGMGDHCDECSQTPVYFYEARSAVNYDTVAKDVVHRLKYGGARYLVKPITQFMLDVLLLSDWSVDCVTFVPMHKKRERKRGYNQAKLIALELCDHIDAPCYALLEKSAETVNQAKLDRNERLENLNGAFKTTGDMPERILLVDDVMTTGATLNECARTLKKAGAKTVYALTFASVPERPLLDTPQTDIALFRR